jgi:pimeloyl-ACP methyl ester carboxylesterase
MAGWAFGPSASEALRREFIEGLRAVAPGVVHRDFAACNDFDVGDRLGEITAPALVVCGSEDRLTPPRYSTHLRGRLAGARLELVAGAGHMVMLEAPAQVAQAFAAFLHGR